jgi:hypothetical protein
MAMGYTVGKTKPSAIGKLAGFGVKTACDWPKRQGRLFPNDNMTKLGWDHGHFVFSAGKENTCRACCRLLVLFFDPRGLPCHFSLEIQ